jgi:hypothetical protein
MYTCIRGIDFFSVSMIFFIIIIINVHVPDQYSDMYINNNKNKRYHRNRKTINTSDTCIHDRSLYWSGTCTLIIIIIKDIIETEKQSIPLSMISFIIIIINVHVPDQYSERSCIHVLEVLIVSLFL